MYDVANDARVAARTAQRERAAAEAADGPEAPEVSTLMGTHGVLSGARTAYSHDIHTVRTQDSVRMGARRVLAAYSPRTRRVLAAYSPRTRCVLAVYLPRAHTIAQIVLTGYSPQDAVRMETDVELDPLDAFMGDVVQQVSKVGVSLSTPAGPIEYSGVPPQGRRVLRSTPSPLGAP